MSGVPGRIEQDTATASQIADHLRVCANRFDPPLADRVVIEDYAAKLARHATRLEAWDGALLVGLVAVYCNNPEGGAAYISSVSVAQDHERRGIGAALVRRAIDVARVRGFARVSLEVGLHNASALALYTRLGFTMRTDEGAGGAAMTQMDLALREPQTAGGQA